MKNTILSVLAAISVASCSPIPSGTKTEGVHNSTGITCAKILDNTVSDEDIHNSIMNNHWNQWQLLITIIKLENIIKSIDPKKPLSIEGRELLDRQYTELEEHEKNWKEIQEKDIATRKEWEEQLNKKHKKHLMELLELFNKHGLLELFFSKCMGTWMKNSV